MIRQKDLFLAAYGNLYANQGATTPGIEPNDTVDAMSLARIDKIIEKLDTGTYRWTPVKRTYIEKKNGQKRPLGVPGWNDKMLQEVIRMILNAYYEPQFSEHSHGFRPGRGCHTALETIRRTWMGTKWFIEGDIQGCFDNIDHILLLDIIGRDIQDERLRKLLREMLEAGYMEDWQHHKTYSGTVQGGVVSPILSNIVLNELDKFIENELVPHYTKGQRRRKNPEYERLSKRMVTARRQRDIARYRRLEQQRRAIPSNDPWDENFRRLKFLRYADDFILGFAGPRVEAVEIKARIADFLKTIKLTLSAEKTLITHAARGSARFLGYDIYIAQNNSRITQHQSSLAPKKSRAVNGKMMLSVPREVANEWQRRYTRNGKPTHLAELLNHSDYEIVAAYDREFRGLRNYYILAPNLSKRLSPVRYACRQSLVKTLAAKHRKPTTWVYRRYMHKQQDGRKVIRVSIPRESPKRPLTATFGVEPLRYVKSTIIQDEVVPLHFRPTELVQRLLAETCELCGFSQQVEVHHVRRLADIKKKYRGRQQPPPWAVFMMERNRKTVVVCRQCHHKIHAGIYDGPRLR
jgi:group II intron reverse transcriptase/maturase